MPIQLRDIRVSYGEEGHRTMALRGVSFNILERDFTLVVGPSGSGKSSLLSIIGLMLAPDEGDVRICGSDAHALSATERAAMRLHNIGFMFQAARLLAGLTALENVMLPMRLTGMPTAAARKRALALLDELGMADRWDHRPHQLSGGESQRIAVCRALANDPSIILADEPTASLDSRAGHAVMAMLARIIRRKGVSIVMVTHDNRVLEFGDRTIRIEDGMIAGDTRRNP